MKFAGEISSRMQGFYRNKYTTPDGKEVRYGASTQFEVNVDLWLRARMKATCLTCSLPIVDAPFPAGMSRISRRRLILH